MSADTLHAQVGHERINLGRWRFILLCILMGIGLYVSDQLVLEHISLKLGDEADNGICGSSTLFSCKAAAKSAFGSILGLPIAAIGEAFYLTALLILITIKLSALRVPMDHVDRWSVRLLSALSGATMLSVLYSLFLGTVSVVTLGLVCPLCVSLYGVNLVSGLLMWFSLTPSSQQSRRMAWLTQWKTIWRSAAPWLLTLLMGASLTVAQGGYANRWNAGLKQQRKTAFQTPIQVDISTTGPTKGESSAAQIVEFSDFQCPFCKRFSRNLKQASEELAIEAYPFQYTFKHYPLSKTCNPHAQHDMHPRACHAAAAAICAEEQGKFWEMHDLLFDHQTALEDTDLDKYARELKLDMDRFIECLPSDRVQLRISSDIREGRKAKLKGTPAFYINSWRFSGALPTPKIKALVKRYAYGILEEEKD